MSKKYYGGWLYANKNEHNELRKMGIFGPMIYTPSEGNSINEALGKAGTIEYCLCDYETLLKLQDKYRELWQTKYPYYDSSVKKTTIYPEFTKIMSKKEIEHLKDAHYYWNDEVLAKI